MGDFFALSLLIGPSINPGQVYESLLASQTPYPSKMYSSKMAYLLCFVTEITLPFAFKSSDQCLSLGDAESERKTDTRRNRVEIEKEIVCRCSDRWIIRVTL